MRIHKFAACGHFYGDEVCLRIKSLDTLVRRFIVSHWTQYWRHTSSMTETAPLPILDLSQANSPHPRKQLLKQLHDALFNVGFLYIKNHGVSYETITALTSLLPILFDQPNEAKALLSKMNSPHFLGYSGFAEEVTLGQQDLREQFDFATELPVIYDPGCQAPNTNNGKDFSKLYYRLRGPNQWPSEERIPGFRKAFLKLAILLPAWLHFSRD